MNTSTKIKTNKNLSYMKNEYLCLSIRSVSDLFEYVPNWSLLCRMDTNIKVYW